MAPLKEAIESYMLYTQALPYPTGTPFQIACSSILQLNVISLYSE